MQQTVRPEIKEVVKNLKGRLKGEEEKINVGAEDKRRSILSREGGIDFYPQWSTQQGVREEKWEGELCQEGRGYEVQPIPRRQVETRK